MANWADGWYRDLSNLRVKGKVMFFRTHNFWRGALTLSKGGEYSTNNALYKPDVSGSLVV